MSKKPWRNKGEKGPLPNPRKYSWKQVKKFKTFEDADKERNKLKSEGSLVKIRRCGPDGKFFKVVLATEIKSNKKLKGEKDAPKQ
tara:strand:+ start:210 stop:464 length:255 start_codon:yes stop_codon:yes gene_type:complete